MTKVEKIETEVQELSRDELAVFREWFREFDSDEWDRQIEADVRSGELDGLAEEALSAHKAGTTQEL